jgi:hypothetical protein
MLLSITSSIVSILGVLAIVFYCVNRIVYSPRIYFRPMDFHREDDSSYRFQVLYSTRSKHLVEILDSIVTFAADQVLVIASEQDEIVRSSPLLNVRVTKRHMGLQSHGGLRQYIDHLASVGIGLHFVPRAGVRQVDLEVIVSGRVRENQLCFGADMFPPKLKTFVEELHFEVLPPFFDLDAKTQRPDGFYPIAISTEGWMALISDSLLQESNNA